MKQIAVIYLLVICCLQTKAQTIVLEPDSISTVKTWTDNNGKNELTVSAFAACNYYDTWLHSPDGYPSAITSTLKNDKRTVTAYYNLEDFMLQMLQFYDEGIWFKDIDGVQAVFIPVFYCAMLDSDMKLSYIVIYDKHKYVFNFNFLWHEGSENVTMVEPNLDKKLRKMPEKLKSVFKNYLINNYTTFDDIAPTHHTFENSKFRSNSKIGVTTISYYTDYPYILLDKINSEIRQNDYKKASEYLLLFKKVYIDHGYNMEDFNENEEIPKIENKEEAIITAKELTAKDQYIEAYKIYKEILKNKTVIH